MLREELGSLPADTDDLQPSRGVEVAVLVADVRGRRAVQVRVEGAAEAPVGRHDYHGRVFHRPGSEVGMRSRIDDGGEVVQQLLHLPGALHPADSPPYFAQCCHSYETLNPSRYSRTIEWSFF